MTQVCSSLSASQPLDPAQVLDDGALPQSGSFANATQQCFALKQGLDPLLDLARITFTQLTEEIHDLVASYRTKHKMPLLKVRLAGLGLAGA